MEDEIILNDWNPSEQTLRYWAYNEHVLLDEQEEDLVLHQEAYLVIELQAVSRIQGFLRRADSAL